MRLGLLLALAVLFSSPNPAAAASRESVEAMFAASGMGPSWDAGMTASLDAMFASVERTVATRISTSPPRSARQVRVDAALARVRQLMRSVDGIRAFQRILASRVETVMPQIRQTLLDLEAVNAAEAASAASR